MDDLKRQISECKATINYLNHHIEANTIDRDILLEKVKHLEDFESCIEESKEPFTEVFRSGKFIPDRNIRKYYFSTTLGSTDTTEGISQEQNDENILVAFINGNECIGEFKSFSIKEEANDYGNTNGYTKYYEISKKAQKSVKKELNQMIEETGLMPIESGQEKYILIVDINYLPSELKEESFKDTKSKLEGWYGYKVLLIDGSRQNLQGLMNTQYKPAYFI